MMLQSAIVDAVGGWVAGRLRVAGRNCVAGCRASFNAASPAAEIGLDGTAGVSAVPLVP